MILIKLSLNILLNKLIFIFKHVLVYLFSCSVWIKNLKLDAFINKAFDMLPRFTIIKKLYTFPIYKRLQQMNLSESIYLNQLIKRHVSVHNHLQLIQIYIQMRMPTLRMLKGIIVSNMQHTSRAMLYTDHS